MKRRIILWLWVMMGIAIFLISFLSVEEATSASFPECPSCNSFGVQRFQEKKEAPAFSLKGLDGKPIALSDFRGKPVLLIFWATRCTSCKEELPILEKFSVGKRDQLALLLIAFDGGSKR